MTNEHQDNPDAPHGECEHCGQAIGVIVIKVVLEDPDSGEDVVFATCSYECADALEEALSEPEGVSDGD